MARPRSLAPRDRRRIQPAPRRLSDVGRDRAPLMTVPFDLGPHSIIDIHVEMQFDALAKRFGPSWTWTQIARWTVARANAAEPMPRWQVHWALYYLENHSRSVAS